MDNNEENNEETPKENTAKDGMAFLGIGLLFILITINIVFPVFIAMMKVLFWFIGIGCIIFGINTIIKESKKKK